MSSVHEQPEIMTPPKGGCWRIPILMANQCKEKCKYFINCTHKKKGNYKKS